MPFSYLAAMHKSLFKDLKVLELASVLAGPSVGQFFAEMGARVIKVENTLTGGDSTRQWRLSSESPDKISAYYSSVNAGKEVMMKDLTKSADLNDVYRELSDADVIVSNFKAGGALKLGVDYARVKAINPQIIYAEVTGFKSTPQRTAYDVVIQAETGWMSINGEPGAKPLKMPLAFMDILAGHQLKEGILAALWNREKTGKGARVSCSLEEAGIASLYNQASNYLHAGVVPGPKGSLHPNIAPYGEIMTCADGKQVVLAIGSERQFGRLCKIIGLDEIAEHPNYSSNQLRVQNREALYEDLTRGFASLSQASILEACTAQQVPIGAIKKIDEVFESDTAKAMIYEDKKLRSRSVRGNAFEISTE